MQDKLLFQQIDSVSMGSPLGATVSNFFLAKKEFHLLQQQLNYSTKICVNDIFAIFNKKNFGTI